MDNFDGGTNGGEPISENANHDTFTRAQDKRCKLSDTPACGDALTGKENKIIRIFFENVDGFVVPDKKKNINDKNKHKQT